MTSDDTNATPRLVTKAETTSKDIVELLEEALAYARANPCRGLALALITPLCGVRVMRADDGQRVLLLGAITDMQHIVARDGEGDEQ